MVVWTTIRIPKNSEINKLIAENSDITAWKVIEEVITDRPRTKEQKINELFDKFILDIDHLCPGKKDELESLRPYILKNKFVPGISMCGGCEYFDMIMIKCNRPSGPKIGINKYKQKICIVKDIH